MTDRLLSAEQAARLLGVSAVRVRQLARQGRIVGAQRIGTTWVIPVRRGRVHIDSRDHGPRGVADR